MGVQRKEIKLLDRLKIIQVELSILEAPLAKLEIMYVKADEKRVTDGFNTIIRIMEEMFDIIDNIEKPYQKLNRSVDRKIKSKLTKTFNAKTGKYYYQ